MRAVVINIAVFILFLSPIQSAFPQDQKLSRIVQQLVEKGFKKCSGDLDRVVKYIHDDDTRYGMLNTWSATDPDARSSVTVSSERTSDTGSMIVTITATPDSSGKCTISAAQIFVTSKSCIALREDTFKTWKFFGELSATGAYEASDGSTLTVYLTPTQSGGCLALRQAIFYY